MSYNLIVSERNLVYNYNAYQKFKFYLYRFANKIVPNSESQRLFIEKHYPHYIAKTETITNFTDTEHFSVLNHSKRKGCKFRILVVARISKQKNIERFLLAFKEICKTHQDVQVDWFGNPNHGDENYAVECMSLVTKYNLNEHFFFHKAVTNIRDEYQKCDVFCLPSLFEGYPNVVCEAMSCGKPILCSNVCDNSSIVDNEVNGLLFNPEHVEVLPK